MSHCRATKCGPVLQNEGMGNWAIEDTSYDRYRLPVLNIALFMLIALPELLLTLIIVGRHGRQNEGQNSKKPNQSQDGIAIEMATCAQTSPSPCAGIALDYEIHGSVSTEPLFRYYAGESLAQLGVLEREGVTTPSVFRESGITSMLPLPGCQLVKNPCQTFRSSPSLWFLGDSPLLRAIAPALSRHCEA